MSSNIPKDVTAAIDQVKWAAMTYAQHQDSHTLRRLTDAQSRLNQLLEQHFKDEP